MIKQCKTCRFFDSREPDPEDYPKGNCRHRSPLPFTVNDNTEEFGEGQWPTIFAFDWCGEWEGHIVSTSGETLVDTIWVLAHGQRVRAPITAALGARAFQTIVRLTEKGPGWPFRKGGHDKPWTGGVEDLTHSLLMECRNCGKKTAKEILAWRDSLGIDILGSPR